MQQSPPNSEQVFKSRGTPGASVRSRGLSQALFPFIGMVFISGWAFGAVVPLTFLSLGKAAILLFVLAAAVAVTWKRALNLMARHEEGARGEEQVARTLETLPEGWRVYHGVPLAEKTIDHVVVSPDQVFMVETVHWLGQIRLMDGHLLHEETAYPGYHLDDVHARARQAAEELGISQQAVKPLICIVGGRFNERAGENNGVWIGEIQDVGSYLLQKTGTGFGAASKGAILEKLDSLLNQEDE